MTKALQSSPLRNIGLWFVASDANVMKHNNKKRIFFITGASGVGKTTLVDILSQQYTGKGYRFFHFDSIGVPSDDIMQKEYGSGVAWQKAKTDEWIEKLVRLKTDEKLILEGQVNLQFIRDSFKRHQFKNYCIVLIDCNESIMAQRLAGERGQPELFTSDMKKWRQYLRKQAEELRVEIIDTSNLTTEEALSMLKAIVSDEAPVGS